MQPNYTDAKLKAWFRRLLRHPTRKREWVYSTPVHPRTHTGGGRWTDGRTDRQTDRRTDRQMSNNTLFGCRRLSVPTRSCCNSISFCSISCWSNTFIRLSTSSSQHQQLNTYTVQAGSRRGSRREMHMRPQLVWKKIAAYTSYQSIQATAHHNH